MNEEVVSKWKEIRRLRKLLFLCQGSCMIEQKMFILLDAKNVWVNLLWLCCVPCLLLSGNFNHAIEKEEIQSSSEMIDGS